MIKFENATNGRFFYIKVEGDLLNAYALTIIRGGRQSCVTRRAGFDNRLDLEQEVQRLIKRRLSRGYALLSDPFAKEN